MTTKYFLFWKGQEYTFESHVDRTRFKMQHGLDLKRTDEPYNQWEMEFEYDFYELVGIVNPDRMEFRQQGIVSKLLVINGHLVYQVLTNNGELRYEQVELCHFYKKDGGNWPNPEDIYEGSDLDKSITEIMEEYNASA